MNLDIENNTTLNRKLTYEPSVLNLKKNMKNNKNINVEHSKNIVDLPDSSGLYVRPNNYTDYINNYMILKRTIQINSSNRDVKIFKSPFNFITYVANNQIVNNGPLIQVLSNGATPIMKPDPKYDTYLAPRIGTIIPNISKINLNKIIIPNYLTS